MTLHPRKKKKDQPLISFAAQLNRVFIIIILVPVLLLGGLSTYYSFTQVRAQRNEEVQNLIQQSHQDFNDVFVSCENSLRYLAANSTLLNFLLTDNDDYLQISRDAKTIRMLFYNTMTTNPYCEEVVLYSGKYQEALSGFIEAPPESEDWYAASLKSDYDYWFTQGGSAYVARKLISAYHKDPLGVLCMKLKPSALTDNVKIFSMFPAHISIQDSGKTMWEYSTDSWASRNYIRERFILGSADWTLYYKVTVPNYSATSMLPFLLLFLSLLLAWGITHFSSRRLSAELTLLVQDVKKAQDGDLDVQIYSSRISEISFLSESIQTFLSRIKQLIDQVYNKELQRQDLELNLLRAKINPHFLYNNLSTINWLALSCGQEQISEIATELSEFYRTALNKGKDIDRLSVELKNVKAYLNLQLIAHRNSFDVVYDCPAEFLDCEIPLFILQPLVENAIEHGIDQTPDVRGRILIQISGADGWLTMRVVDNGRKLHEKIGSAQLPERDFGYATQNIHRRIQLLYGEESGLTISASEQGTTSLLRFRYTHLRHIQRIF